MRPNAIQGTCGFAAAATLAALAACGKSASSAAPTAIYGASAPVTNAAAASPSADTSPAASAAAATSVATAATSSVRPAGAVGSLTLAYPDDLQMVMLARHLAGTPAPVDDWAQKAPSVRQADEFSRAAAQQAETTRLNAIQAASADVGFVRLKTDGNISEYDSTRGGFYLFAFEPGTVYKFSAYDETVTLAFDNIGDAYLWPLAAARAQDLLKQIPYRAVDIDLHAAIVGVEHRASGIQLIGHLSDFRISSRGSSARQLDEVRLK